jgi:hypothetical protein
MDEILDPELLPWLVEAGLVELGEIKAAADGAIARENRPAELLIDLSLSTSLDEVLRRVRPDLTVRPTDRAKAEVLARLRQRMETGSLDVNHAVARYHQFATRHLEASEDVWVSAIAMEDAYELAVQGVHGTVDGVRRDLLSELARLEADLR